MNELVQDLTSALEESELKIEVDDDKFLDKDLPKRKIKRHRPIGVNYCSHSMMHDSYIAVAHCRVNVCRNQCKNTEGNVTGSDTESGFVPPVVRKHRRRKVKHMETETYQLSTSSMKKKHFSKKLMKNVEFDVNSPIRIINNNKSKTDDESGVSASDDSDEDGTAQDGDDEMTDFFNEASEGSVCGIPSVNPWWEEDNNIDDPRLKNIINGAFPNLSESAQRGFHARINRLPGMAARSIRKGRRRLKNKKVSDRSMGNDISTAHHVTPTELDRGAKRYQDTKPRQQNNRTSKPLCHLPIPDTNRGHQMLVGMGWKPGDGLGASSQGMRNPVTVNRRSKRQGLGS